jgi:hypothetical protein
MRPPKGECTSFRGGKPAERVPSRIAWKKPTKLAPSFAPWCPFHGQRLVMLLTKVVRQQPTKLAPLVDQTAHNQVRSSVLPMKETVRRSTQNTEKSLFQRLLQCEIPQNMCFFSFSSPPSSSHLRWLLPLKEAPKKKVKI